MAFSLAGPPISPCAIVVLLGASVVMSRTVAEAPTTKKENGLTGLPLMRRHLVGGIYVVEAKKDGVTDYWAAATIRENAVAAVEKEWGHRVGS
jgi:hypothetical protein